MRVSPLSLLAAAAALATASSSVAAVDGDFASRRSLARPARRGTATLHAPPAKRSPATNDVQASIVAQAATDPVGAAIAAQGLDGIRGNVDGGDLASNTIIPGDSESNANPIDNQYPWNRNVPFLPNADATPGTDSADPDAQGWQGLPDLPGFDLVRDQVVKEGATMPYYITAGYDPTQVKKAVITMPGKPRDSWKYANLVRNAFNAALTNQPQWGLTNGSVIILSPAWLNQHDQQFGAARPSDLVFHGSQWQSGGTSRSPNLSSSITTYEAIDWFTDWLFDRAQFPALNGVTISGHSMGGQAVERYAVLKKQKSYDDNMSYWVGNPGSFVWLTGERPMANSSCPDYDTWHYGLGGNTSQLTKYARKDVEADKDAVVQRFRGRRVHYGLGLLDNGPGDRHCEAVMQGGNHLDRGVNFIQMLGQLDGGFPLDFQTVNFIANASHQDYAMLSANSTMQHLFKDGYDTRLPDIVASNPGDSDNRPAINPNPPARAFATPVHKKVAYGLLGGSIGLAFLVFTVLPYLFPVNVPDWQQRQWEVENKRGLGVR